MEDPEYKLKKHVQPFYNNHQFFMKPIPTPPVEELQQFLSIDLVEKKIESMYINLTSIIKKI